MAKPKKPKATEMTAFPLRLPEQMHLELKELCDRKGRVMNSEIIHALRRHMLELAKAPDLIPEEK